MNKTLEAILENYGIETVIGRILEQLKLLAFCEDDEVVESVKSLLLDSGCDTEYLYNLCEYTNLATYASEDVCITDSPWSETEEI